MHALYEKLLKTAEGKKGLSTVDVLAKDSGLLSSIRDKLTNNGFNIARLTDKGVAILFCSLVDIVFVVKGDSFYLATLSQNKLYELLQQNRLIKRDDEQSFSQRSSQIITGNTVGVINQYLEQGKFHFIKLNMVEYCKPYYFLASVSTMNPYPNCESERVYSLQDVSRWHIELYNALLGGCYRLKLANGSSEVCQSYLSKVRSVCTSGNILTRDLDCVMVNLPLWDVIDYEHYVQDEAERQFIDGVVKYDGTPMTLNREVLEQYYGGRLYTQLESIGVRRRYCLEELLSLGNKYSVAYYVNKYNLQIFDCKTLVDLENKLRDLIKQDGDKSNDNPSIIHARVLLSPEMIAKGYKSFYRTVNLANINTHDVEVVEQVSAICPKRYEYYGVGTTKGYASVTVKATSESLAMQYGRTEFIRQFGGDVKFCSLECQFVLIKGLPILKLKPTLQKELWQSLRYGYTMDFDSYANKLRKLCKKNDIDDDDIKDEHIKFLFVNELAKIKPKAMDLTLSEVILCLINFIGIMQSKTTADNKLKEAYTEIAHNKVKKEFGMIEQVLPECRGYYVDDTPDGRFIKTEYGRYKIAGNKLYKTVELFYKGESLGTKVIK